jgi:enoyl-CoA hydratase/carnithine racemase
MNVNQAKASIRSSGSVFRKTKTKLNKFDFAMDDHVALVTMKDGDNLINPDFIHEAISLLDYVENNTEASTLVFHSANPKIFTLGVDLDWMVKKLEEGKKEKIRKLFFDLDELFVKILLYPMPTISVINGHVFGIGAVFSCTFDFRFMRSERGYFCLPEVDLGIPLIPGMMAILSKVIPVTKLVELLYTGKRAAAEECLSSGIVMKTCPGENLLNEAMNFGKTLNKKRSFIGEMKKRINRDIVRVIQDTDPTYIITGESFYS